MKLKTYLCAGAAFCSLSLAGSTAAAVDFAFCKGGFEATDLSCFQQSQYGDNITMVEKSVGEMYNRGWAVISVYLNRAWHVAGTPPKDPEGTLYYYFEK
jgi:hypothetical protein